MRRRLLTIQYLGTRYAGWQSQSNAVGVQQVIEAALSRLCESAVILEASGRTDAGVHAQAQCAHADVPARIPDFGLLQSLNNILPADVRITSVRTVADAFHARFDVREKTYVYRIWNERTANVFLAPTHAHIYARLDEAAMSEAGAALLGHHDFSAFTVTEPAVRSTWRTLTRLEVVRRGSVVEITATADGFLRFMVRKVAGSLIEAGKGRIAAKDVKASLEPAFETARWTAPPEGLTLHEVVYPDQG